MIKYKIKITLKSDMCCGTGVGDGAEIDTMTAFDDVGLPIIPAKRLKGLLREQGEFIVKYGKHKKRNVIKLFGDLNDKHGLIRVSNAVIENYDEIRSELTSAEYPPDEVSAIFTAYRTQTCINNDGVAYDHSLRVTQTIKKGTIFFADIDVDSNCYTELLTDCVKALRHIGLNKTRGFGEVECDIDCMSESEYCVTYNYIPKGECVALDYTITLEDDVVISGGSNISTDYIPGAMIQGVFARLLNNAPE
jgi:CRISPR/Cas system CSM-associated protein Csm3 (group 7 of RAMP superfamily)